MKHARGGGDFAAHAQVARHLGPAQVEVAILEAQFLVHFAGDFRVIDRERQHIGMVQNFQCLGRDFHFAGGDFGIVRACGALADFAGDADDAFAAQARRLARKVLRQIGGIENGLGAAFAVADIDENEPAEVAAGMDPAGQSNGLADMLLGVIRCNDAFVSFKLRVRCDPKRNGMFNPNLAEIQPERKGDHEPKRSQGSAPNRPVLP